MTDGPLLQTILPTVVEAAEVLLPAALTELTAREATQIRSAREKRVREFQAGRHCARAALARLGITGFSLLNDPDRAPCWPPGVAGSLTHTTVAEKRTWSGVAVARIADLASIGIDAEPNEDLDAKLWPRILYGDERNALEAEASADRGKLARLVFSAKESVYKCQYALSRQFLEFSDVSLEWDARRGTFVGTLRRDAGPFETGRRFPGRFLATDTVLLTAVVLEAGW